jgi:hypothetical protein
MSTGDILAIVFGITTVIGIIVTIELSKKKQPFWSFSTETVLRINPDAPKGLKLTFNDNPIDILYRTKLIFFNKGNDPIEPINVKEKVVISFGKARILSEPDYKPNRPQIKFNAKKVTIGTNEGIELDFSFLDHDDGALVEVLHAEKASIDKVAGVISGAKIRRIKEFDPAKRMSFLAEFKNGGFLLMLAGTIGLTYIGIKQSISEGWQPSLTIALVFWGLLAVGTLQSYRQFARFPKWASGEATSITKADAVVDQATKK